MFPAILALADAIGKEVVVVEYDPMKLNTIKKLYNEEKRRSDFREKKNKGKNPRMATVRESKSTDSNHIEQDLELGPAQPTGPQRVRSGEYIQGITAKQQTRARPRRLRMMSAPAGSIGGKGFWDSGGDDSGEEKIKGVKCEYADIHDPECWEELEMDRAFMLVCTIKGARHAEKAMLKWLRKQGSDAIFVACTQNNVEAIRMYRAGAHFVMQTDALAMRSTRDIFLETVANIGDCSQLVAAGLAHKKRLLKLQADNILKFQYETG